MTKKTRTKANNIIALIFKTKLIECLVNSLAIFNSIKRQQITNNNIRIYIDILIEIVNYSITVFKFVVAIKFYYCNI